jgi:hypothetical protein
VKEQIIDVEQFDDVASVRDKLRWARADKVLLVLPDSSDHRIAKSKLDLLLLQREAARHGAALALITHDPVIIDFAREIQLPCFRSVEENRTRHWAAPPKPRILEQPPPHLALSADLVESGTRLRQADPLLPQPIVSAWMRVRWAAAGIFILGAALFLVPGATISIQPLTNQVTASTPITGDPQSTAVDLRAGTIPVRIVGVEVDATASTDATGTVDVPTDKARGIVILTNQIPDQITIPAGTIVRTSAAQPVRFVTLADVTLAGRVGATVDVTAEAVEGGFEGNLQSNKINIVDGPLGTRVAVTNPSPMLGGNVVEAQSISRQDFDRVRTLAIQQLQQRAFAEMQVDPYIKLLDTEFIPAESLIVVLINAETYSASVGDTTGEISLTMRATVQGTAIDERAARQVVYARMAEKIGPGYEIEPDTLVFRKGQVTALDENRRITFIMDAAGDVATAIDEDEVRGMIAGMPVRDVQARLQRDLQLGAVPTISIWPGFWPLMPLAPFRIAIVSTSR